MPFNSAVFAPELRPTWVFLFDWMPAYANALITQSRWLLYANSEVGLASVLFNSRISYYYARLSKSGNGSLVRSHRTRR